MSKDSEILAVVLGTVVLGIVVLVLACMYMTCRHDEKMAELGYQKEMLVGTSCPAWRKCK